MYHTPTYRLLLVELTGLKKPKEKVSPGEIKTSPSERHKVGVRVSLDVEEYAESRMIMQVNVFLCNLLISYNIVYGGRE